MKPLSPSRRQFLKLAGAVAGARAFGPGIGFGEPEPLVEGEYQTAESKADYTLHIAANPIEIAHNRIVSGTTYNGQFPGPLLRFKEGQPVVVDVFNDTDTPEQLHWHGQFVPTDVDGAAEEGTPFIPAHGTRRIAFTPRPAGFRFYHTHNRAGADLHAGQYSGQVGPVYIEPKHELGSYDREVFLVLNGISAQIAAGLLLLLAAFVLVASVGSLIWHIETRPSLLGIGLLITASVVMPWLARQKRRLSGATASATLPADAAQSALCGYMAWIALTGLILNAIWSIGWADPFAALVLTPLILREGCETARANLALVPKHHAKR